jgi:hypothetical protein
MSVPRHLRAPKNVRYFPDGLTESDFEWVETCPENVASKFYGWSPDPTTPIRTRNANNPIRL